MLRSVVLCAALVACRNDTDPGFEIVRVPLSAYAAPDASAPDAANESGATGPGPVVVCIGPKPSDDDDSNEGDADCADTHEGRAYDPHATERHRKKEGEENVCCYRRGRTPRSHEEEE